MGMTFQSKMLAVMPANAKSGGTNNIVAIQKAVIEGTNTDVSRIIGAEMAHHFHHWG